jgi:hypothetical protein
MFSALSEEMNTFVSPARDYVQMLPVDINADSPRLSYCSKMSIFIIRVFGQNQPNWQENKPLLLVWFVLPLNHQQRDVPIHERARERMEISMQKQKIKPT